MTLSFMPAQPEDSEPIFALAKNLIDRYEDLSQINYPKVLNCVRRKINNQIGDYTRICLNSEMVGYYHLADEEDRTELDDFYVLPCLQGQGIGTAALQHCMQLTGKPIYLYVFKANFRAIALYERFGFRKEQDVGTTRMILVREG